MATRTYTQKMHRLQHAEKSDTGKKIEAVALTIQHMGFAAMADEWRRLPARRRDIAEYFHDRLAAKHPTKDLGRRFAEIALDAIASTA